MAKNETKEQTIEAVKKIKADVEGDRDLWLKRYTEAKADGSALAGSYKTRYIYAAEKAELLERELERLGGGEDA